MKYGIITKINETEIEITTNENEIINGKKTKEKILNDGSILYNWKFNENSLNIGYIRYSKNLKLNDRIDENTREKRTFGNWETKMTEEERKIYEESKKRIDEIERICKERLQNDRPLKISDCNDEESINRMISLLMAKKANLK